MTERPDPAQEIRITTLHATRGLNFWSKRPVIRMDVAVGAYDHISSADAAGVTEALVREMPGLRDHECSVGAPGGFVCRLRRGTYAPHIIEHVALELQSMVGLEVGYGRTRGGDSPGEYTLVFEHRHEQVGLRAAALALEAVQRAFAGTLETMAPGVEELTLLARTPDPGVVVPNVFCGVTGGSHRAEVQQALRRCLDGYGGPESVVVDVAPAYLLQAGLPYARSEMAVITDTHLTDVPERYQERDRAQRLVSIVADAVTRGGVVICPAKEWEIQDYARDQDCRVAVFSTGDDITRRDQRVAIAMACVRDGRIAMERFGEAADGGALDADADPVPQVAGALASFLWQTDPRRATARATTQRA